MHCTLVGLHKKMPSCYFIITFFPSKIQIIPQLKSFCITEGCIASSAIFLFTRANHMQSKVKLIVSTDKEIINRIIQ